MSSAKQIISGSMPAYRLREASPPVLGNYVLLFGSQTQRRHGFAPKEVLKDISTTPPTRSKPLFPKSLPSTDSGRFGGKWREPTTSHRVAGTSHANAPPPGPGQSGERCRTTARRRRPEHPVAVAVEAGHNPVAHRREQRPPRRRRRRRPRRAGAWLPSPPKSATGLISPPQDLTTLRAPFCAIWRWSLMPLGAGAKQPLAGAPPARVARRGGREWRRAPNAALVGKAHAAGVRRETHASAAAAPVGPVQRLGPVQHNTPDRPKW
eukprot:gene13180-biopygen7798